MQKQVKTVRLLIISFLLVSLILGACANEVAPPKPSVESKTSVTEIRLVSMWDLSSLYAGTNPLFMKGFDGCIRYVNEKNLLPGVKINHEWIDHASSVDRGVTAFKGLLAESNPPQLIACSTTGVTAGLKPLVEKAKIPLMSDACTGFLFPKDGYVYAYPSTFDIGNAGMLKWIADDWAKKSKTEAVKVGYICWDHPAGKAYLPQVKTLASQLGVKVVGEELVPTSSTDMTTELNRLMKLKPDYVIANVWLGSVAVVLKDAQRVGYKDAGIQILLPNEAMATSTVSVAGSSADGVMGLSCWGVSGDSAEGVAKARTFLRDFCNEANWSEELVYGLHDGAVTYEALRLALKKVTPNELNLEKFKEYGLDKLDGIVPFDWQGLWGKTDYSHGSRVGVKSFRIVKWKGSMQAVSDWFTAPQLPE